MNHRLRQSKIRFQNPEELRASQWLRLEEEILERAFVLWRRKGRAHMDALKALRQAEQEILSQEKKFRITKK